MRHYEPPTAGQVAHLIQLFLDSGISKQGADALLKGPVSDLFTCDTDRLDRNALRAALNQTPIVPKLRRNRHGHIVLTVEGCDRRGELEINQSNGRLLVSDSAKRLMRSNSYDAQHRMEWKQQYQLVIVPAARISCERISGTISTLVETWFGYEPVVASAVPRMAEVMRQGQLEQMGLSFVVAMHEPIRDSDGAPAVLGIETYLGQPMINAYKADIVWPSNAGFIFFDPHDA